MKLNVGGKGLAKAEIFSNLNLTGDYFLMSMNVPDNYVEARPGQFVMLRADLRETPLLSRPFSIYSISGGEGAVACLLLYRVVGNTTRLLSRKKPGDFVYVLGPLGRGFDTSGDFEKSVLVAGGTGIAPISFLSELLMKSGSQDVSFYYGAKSAKDLLGLERLEKQYAGRLDLKICTEDCSRGEAGVVTALLQRDLGSLSAGARVFACGPAPMLRSLKTLLSGARVPVQVSIEEKMACGIGACLACAVRTESGYVRVCTEGPVFDLDKVELD